MQRGDAARMLDGEGLAEVTRIQQEDALFYERLRATGFMLTFGEDESGIGLMYARCGAGYSIDVGAAQSASDLRSK